MSKAIDIPAGWHIIHDFLRGYGYRYYDGENELGTEKVVFARDAQFHLGIDIQDRQDLDEIYEQLQPKIEAWREERRKSYKPLTIKTITLPKVNRVYPEL